MSDRKYKQRGYQDSGRDDRRDSAPARRPPPENLGGPRHISMPGRRLVMRCAACGTVLAPDIDTAGRCPRCNFELHSCKQCACFDPGSRFECSRPVTARIARKDARNECTLYEARTTVEKETSSSRSRPPDARSAFENLFKK